jgi:hypothetical protein
MTRLVPVLALVLSVGLVRPGFGQDTPAANRYRTGATYLEVTMVQVDLDARTATLDIRWDASWRDAENWDAAWIVLKGRRERRPSDGPLVPLRVGGTPAVTANRSSDGAEAAFRVPDDRMGFFVHRAARGEGDNRWRVQVAWAAADGVDAAAVEGVAAFGVEMVRVPTGAFELGTTRPRAERREATARAWFPGTNPGPSAPSTASRPKGTGGTGGHIR